MAEELNRASISDKRILALETNLIEIHRLLALIQTRLIGGLDTDRPGITSDIKNLQDRINIFEKDLAELKIECATKTRVGALEAELSEEKTNIKQEMAELWAQFNRDNKFRWMILGGLAVIDFLVMYVEYHGK